MILNKIDSLLTHKRVVAYSRIILIALLLFFIFGYIFNTIQHETFNTGDFRAFYTAGIILSYLEGDNYVDLYNFDTQRNVQEKYGLIKSNESPTIYINPPTFAWLMVPFTKLPYVFALNIWRFFSLLIAIFSINYLTKELKLGLNWGEPFTILLASVPGFITVLSGQNSFLFLGVYTIVFALLSKGHDFSAGCFLGIGLLKPQLIWLLPALFILHRKWKAFLGFTLAALFIFINSYYLVGFKGISEFVALFMSDIYIEGLQAQAHKMHSVPSFIRLIYGLNISTASLSLAAIAIIMIMVGYMMTKNCLEFELTKIISLSILGAIIASPHLFHYDLSLLALPYLFLYSWTKESGQGYLASRNVRLCMLSLYFILWTSLFITEVIKVQISVILIIYLFVFICRQFLKEQKVKNINNEINVS